MSKYIAVDIGGTKILGSLFNEDGKILSRHKVKTGAHRGRRPCCKLSTASSMNCFKVMSNQRFLIPGVVRDGKYVQMCSNVPLELTFQTIRIDSTQFIGQNVAVTENGDTPIQRKACDRWFVQGWVEDLFLMESFIREEERQLKSGIYPIKTTIYSADAAELDARRQRQAKSECFISSRKNKREGSLRRSLNAFHRDRCFTPMIYMMHGNKVIPEEGDQKDRPSIA